MGTFFVLILLPFLVYVLYQCFRIVLTPAERRARSIRLGIWVTALMVAGTTHGYHSVTSRKAAEAAVGKVAAFKAQTARYPEHLGEVGLSADKLKEKWRIRYSLKEGVPTLAYPSHFMPMSMNEYDFHTGKWRVDTY